MRAFRYVGTALLAAVVGLVPIARLGAQQNIPDPLKVQIEASVSGIYLIPITNTAAVNNQVTLTIPAPPPGLFNYVCKLDFNASQDGTSSAVTNGTVTSTNFNAWAWKFSLAATARINYDHSWDFGTPATGCAKSAAAGTATTFVSPAAAANTAFVVSAMYFQAK